MINYRQFNEGFKKMMESERKCGEFVNFLGTKRRIMRDNNDDESKFTKIDESHIQSCSVITALSQSNTLNNLARNQMENSIYSKQSSSLIEKNKLQSYNVSKISTKKDNLDLLMDYIPDDDESANAYRESNKLQYQNHLQQNSHHSHQEQYFEMDIVLHHPCAKNVLKLTDHQLTPKIQNDSHQVKIFHPQQINISSKRYLNNHNNYFNLSNFSSFNNHNLSQPSNHLLNPCSNNNNNFIQKAHYQEQNQKLFYEQQLSYLIKKIQFIHGRKLSVQGITKIIDQLYQMAGFTCNNNDFAQIENIDYSTYQNDCLHHGLQTASTNQYDQFDSNNNISAIKMRQPKDITNKINNISHSKSNNKQKSSIKPISSTNKKLHFSTLPLSNQVKLKQNNKISSSKCSTNKQNQNFTMVQRKDKAQKTHQEIQKGKQRSISPLSYRVLMEKKKLLQKTQKSSQNQQQIHQNTSLESLPSSFQSNSIKQSGSKPHSLKIILEQIHLNQSRSKTLSFQCHIDTHKPTQIKRAIQRYCEQNSINKTNVNIIMDALTQRRSIITIKSKGNQ